MKFNYSNVTYLDSNGYITFPVTEKAFTVTAFLPDVTLWISYATWRVTQKIFQKICEKAVCAVWPDGKWKF
ncbi:MAG: hypothetical protein NC930_01585 [Candidatus Omnitrophica bacterium]|nr:hypothetical protein [Candidatus Omnitrophota bacterium]